AFAQEPKVLVLDEPLTFLDPHHRALVRRLIARLREARPAVSIIEATHDLSSGFENSTGVLALREGERFFFGAPKDFFRKEILEELYRTPVELVERVGSAVPLVIW